MKNPFKRKKPTESKPIDTSIKGFEYIGVKLTEQQFQNLCMLNSLMIDKNDEHRQRIPVFNIILLLNILGLLPPEMMCKINDGKTSDYCNYEIDEHFQRKFGKFWEKSSDSAN